MILLLTVLIDFVGIGNVIPGRRLDILLRLARLSNRHSKE